MNNCIVVEHDPIAEAVCSENHKDDVGKYIWIKKFEELEEKLDDVMKEYGPIDIVEGGPPCVECKSVLSLHLSLRTNTQKPLSRSVICRLGNQCQPWGCGLS